MANRCPMPYCILCSPRTAGSPSSKSSRCRAKKVLLREMIGADGVVKLVNADGKELAVSKAKLSEATEPEHAYPT